VETGEPNPATGSKPAKATLFDFVEENSKLITAIAAFVALTVFCSQLKDADMQSSLPGVTILGALLLTFELFTRQPAPPRHWRLAVFEMVLLTLLAFMGWYWIKTFPVFWVPLANALIIGIVLLGFGVLVTLLFTKVLTLIAAKVFHKHIAEGRLIRVQQVVFLLATFGLVWASRKGGTVRIHLHF
jgi:hypothetical protein